MNNQAGTLQSRAHGFEAADSFGVTSFANSSQDSSLLKQDPSFLGTLLQNIPESELIKYLQLGAIAFPGTGIALLLASLIPIEYNRKAFIGQQNIFHYIDGSYKIIGDKDDDLLELNIAGWKDTVWEKDIPLAHTTLGGVPANLTASAALLTASAGLGVGLDAHGKPFIGGEAEVTLAEGDITGELGDKNFGVAASGQIEVGNADAFVGYKDGKVGAEIGVDLVKVEGTAGLNVAGANVGVTAGVGIGFKLGFNIGKSTKIELGPFELGLSIGEAS